MRYPLICQLGNGHSPFINHNFVTADLTVDGIIGNFSDKFMDTGFVSDDHWADFDSSGLSIYESDETANLINEETDIGVEGGGDISLTWYQVIAAQSFGRDGALSSVAFAQPDAPAFYTMNRTSDAMMTLHRANSIIPFAQLDTDATGEAGTLLPTNPIYFMALNSGGGDINDSGKRISFMAIHEGLTATESQDLFNSVQDLRIALGGGFV